MINVAITYARSKDSPKLVEKLRLKEGARVMLLTNDRNNQWVNGSTGEILTIRDDFVTVRLDRANAIVDVPRTEEDLLYGSKVIGTVSQFAIRVAYASTIHKSQGLTLDRVGINMSDHFDCGMTYVALSRCRYLNGLFLCGKFPDSIQVDRQALEFLKKYEQTS